MTWNDSVQGLGPQGRSRCKCLRQCGRCTQFCPANQAGGSLSPKEIILDLQKGLVAGGDLIAGTAAEREQGAAFISEEDLFQCFSCGACEYGVPGGH